METPAGEGEESWGGLLLSLGTNLENLAGEFMPDCERHGFLRERMWRRWLRDECRRGVFVY
jgi:hypothetical protein